MPISHEEESSIRHFCYFNYEEFYNAQPLILPDKDESIIATQMEAELEGLSKIEKDKAIKKKIKELRKQIIIMRVHRIRESEDVADLGNLFSFQNDGSYHQAKTKLTFKTPEGEELCFLHDLPSGTPAGLEKIYEMLRSEIFQKEQFRQGMLEAQKQLAEGGNSSFSSIDTEFKSNLMGIFNNVIDFFGRNKVVIKKSGDLTGAKELFMDIADIQQKLESM